MQSQVTEGAAAHSVCAEDRKKFSATAIEGVESFSPSQIVLCYRGGKILVSGSGMRIVAFSKAGGTFAATGTITGIKYLSGGSKLRQRLFR